MRCIMKKNNNIEIINKSKKPSEMLRPGDEIKFKNEIPPQEIPEISPDLPDDLPPLGSIDDTPQEVDPSQVEAQSNVPQHEDIFSDFEGVLPDNITYTIYRTGKSGKREYIAIVNAPYSVQQIAENFGGGDYLVMARDPKSGHYLKRKNVPIARDVYEIDDPESEQDSEMKFLKRFEMYSKLSNSNSKMDAGFMEVMGKQMQMMLQMSNNMMLQQMELMKQFQENMSDGGGDLASMVGLVDKYLDGKKKGKIESLPKKKEKVGEGG